MPSSYSTSLRINLQNTGENSNTWGTLLNSGALSLIDSALAGWTTIALTGNLTLTASNGAADQARSAILKFTGSGAFTVTVPTVSKSYVIWNALSGVLTVTNGSTSVAVQPGEAVQIATDGNANFVRVQPTDFASQRITSVGTPTANSDAATKLYVDNTAFSAAGGTMPGQGGNAGKWLGTDGTVASWTAMTGSGLAVASAFNISVPAAASSDVLTGTDTTKAMTAGGAYGALSEVALTYSSTLAPDMSTFVNAAVTLTGNVTLANPTNPKAGQSGRIRLVQDATGSRLLSAVGTFWKREGGVPTLTTTAAAEDYLIYDVVSATKILYDIIRNPS